MDPFGIGGVKICCSDTVMLCSGVTAESNATPGKIRCTGPVHYLAQYQTGLKITPAELQLTQRTKSSLHH